MNTSLLKKIVASVSAQWATEQVLGLVDTLLVMMKKYGKQLSQASFIAFIQKEYPDKNPELVLAEMKIQALGWKS